MIAEVTLKDTEYSRPENAVNPLNAPKVVLPIKPLNAPKIVQPRPAAKRLAKPAPAKVYHRDVIELQEKYERERLAMR